MTKLVVVKLGGKQYLVEKNDELYVDQMHEKEGALVSINKLAEFDNEKGSVSLGNPYLKLKTKIKILEHVKDDKVRLTIYKSKVRYRKSKGFRSRLSKIKIVEI